MAERPSKIQVIIEAQNRASGAFRAVEGDARGFFRRTKSNLDGLDNTMKALRGAGALGAFTLTARTLEDITGKARQLSEEFAAGKKNASDIADELARSLPYIGSLYATGRNIRAMLSGDTAADAAANQALTQLAASSAAADAVGNLADMQAKYNEQVAKSLTLLQQQVAILNATPDQRPGLIAGFEQANSQTSIADQTKKQLEEIEKARLDAITRTKLGDLPASFAASIPAGLVAQRGTTLDLLRQERERQASAALDRVNEATGGDTGVGGLSDTELQRLIQRAGEDAASRNPVTDYIARDALNEYKDRLQQYLDARDALNEVNRGIDAVNRQAETNRTQTLSRSGDLSRAAAEAAMAKRREQLGNEMVDAIGQSSRSIRAAELAAAAANARTRREAMAVELRSIDQQTDAAVRVARDRGSKTGTAFATFEVGLIRAAAAAVKQARQREFDDFERDRRESLQDSLRDLDVDLHLSGLRELADLGNVVARQEIDRIERQEALADRIRDLERLLRDENLALEERADIEARIFRLQIEQRRTPLRGPGGSVGTLAPLQEARSLSGIAASFAAQQGSLASAAQRQAMNASDQAANDAMSQMAGLGEAADGAAAALQRIASVGQGLSTAAAASRDPQYGDDPLASILGGSIHDARAHESRYGGDPLLSLGAPYDATRPQGSGGDDLMIAALTELAGKADQADKRQAEMAKLLTAIARGIDALNRKPAIEVKPV